MRIPRRRRTALRPATGSAKGWSGMWRRSSPSRVGWGASPPSAGRVVTMGANCSGATCPPRTRPNSTWLPPAAHEMSRRRCQLRKPLTIRHASHGSLGSSSLRHNQIEVAALVGQRSVRRVATLLEVPTASQNHAGKLGLHARPGHEASEATAIELALNWKGPKQDRGV